MYRPAKAIPKNFWDLGKILDDFSRINFFPLFLGQTVHFNHRQSIPGGRITPECIWPGRILPWPSWRSAKMLIFEAFLATRAEILSGPCNFCAVSDVKTQNILCRNGHTKPVIHVIIILPQKLLYFLDGLIFGFRRKSTIFRAFSEMLAKIAKYRSMLEIRGASPAHFPSNAPCSHPGFQA